LARPRTSAGSASYPAADWRIVSGAVYVVVEPCTAAGVPPLGRLEVISGRLSFFCLFAITKVMLFSKSSPVTEALGMLDELNSLLGFIKVKARKKKHLALLLEEAQNTLFIIQAELAGAAKKIRPSKVRVLEKTINEIEKKLPPLKTFCVPGGSELAALLDYARAVARRAERRAVAAQKTKARLGRPALAYLNRLSSLLYVLARLVNCESGIKERAPTYQ
jgi:cob(I)alamin adenosyltransferase